MKLLHILLVEDNRGDVLLIRKALEAHGIMPESTVITDLTEALTLVSRIGTPGGVVCPDVILVDLNLPKVDGLQVLAELRKHPECAQAPVIVVTSSDSPQDRARAAECGIERYFKKPFDFDEYMKLGQVVLEVMGGYKESVWRQ